MHNSKQVEDKRSRRKKQTLHTTYIPNCIKNLKTTDNPSQEDKRFSHAIKDFYVKLVDALKDKEQITARYEEWTKEFDVCKETIKNWLRFFKNKNLIELIGGRGRGRIFIIKLTAWLRKKVELAAKRIKTCCKKRFLELEAKYLKSLKWTTKNPKKTNKVYKHSSIVTKGSPHWRKIALKSREMVESLTDHAKYSSVIVGKVLKIIANRHIDLARDLYRKLKRFLRRELGLSAFYRWLRGWYLPTSWNLLSRHKDELESKRRSKEIEEARKSWQGIPNPPSRKDFARTADWLEATEKWHQKYVKKNSTQAGYQIEGRFP